MDSLSLKPVIRITGICKYGKKEFLRINGAIHYSRIAWERRPHLSLMNNWHRQQSPKILVPARLHCASRCDKYNGSKRCDKTLINLMRYCAQQKNHLERK